MKVSELRSEQELMRAYSVVHELHHDLTEERYAKLLAEMRPQGYRLFAAWEDGEIVAVAGVVVLTNLYYGRHAARAAGCEKAALACGREQEDALRFYKRRGYERPSYAMRKNLR